MTKKKGLSEKPEVLFQFGQKNYIVLDPVCKDKSHIVMIVHNIEVIKAIIDI